MKTAQYEGKLILITPEHWYSRQSDEGYMTSYTIELVIWFISFLIQKAFSDFVVEFASVNLQGLFQTSNFPCVEPNANEQSFLRVFVC